MRRLILLDTAIDDLNEIIRYLSRASASATTGRRFAGRIRAQCAKLATLPGTHGRARPDLRPGIRSTTFRDYVILFRYADDRLEIINIIEGHRDIDAQFPEE